MNWVASRNNGRRGKSCLLWRWAPRRHYFAIVIAIVDRVEHAARVPLSAARRTTVQAVGLREGDLAIEAPAATSTPNAQRPTLKSSSQTNLLSMEEAKLKKIVFALFASFAVK